MTNYRICVMLLWCAACGGSGSGVDSDKRLAALSASELRSLCEHAVEVEGPERTIDCGGGVTLTVGGGTVEECIEDTTASQAAYPNCEATVGDFEACAEAFAAFTDAQLCSDDTEFPAACAPLLSPNCGGGE